jgi:hypothetical protein
LSPKLSKQLRERYPAIFEHVLTVSCRDGWFDLIDTLCAGLQDVTKHGGPQVVATDVKEKYGGLRFYHAGVNDEQDGMIQLAEALSERICEVCGSRGRRRGNGWVTTRCDAHAEPERIAPV